MRDDQSYTAEKKTNLFLISKLWMVFMRPTIISSIFKPQFIYRGINDKFNMRIVCE